MSDGINRSIHPGGRPQHHVYIVAGTTDEVADLLKAIRERRDFGDESFIHKHRAGEPCNPKCAGLDYLIERAKSPNPGGTE